MKRILAILGVVLLAGVVVAVAVPKKKVTNKKITKKVVQKKATKSQKNNEPAVLLVKFRLECQGVGRCPSDGAVMSVSQSSSGDFIYHRAFGDYEGWSYELKKGSCNQLIKELSSIASKKKLYDYKFTKLDDEDLNRPRWLVTMETVDGKEYSIVEYSDGTELRKMVEAAFAPVMEKIGKHELIGPYSHYHYKGDGSLKYRTDHDEEGRVHGGYRPDEPDATF